MPRYRIHRIKEAPRETFRWAPHTGGLAIVKPKDYEFGEDVEASTPYAAWGLLGSEGNPLRPGDLLELASLEGSTGELYIAKYIGFEPAQWFVPEPKGEGVAVIATLTAGPAASAAEELE
jgi:hypothetical protein